MDREILRVENLCTYFYTEAGIVKAVDGVTFSMAKNEPLGLVGESGSGKTVTALSVLGIVPSPGRVVSGSVIYDGQDLFKMQENEMRKIRGRRIGYISQDPNSSLDPLFTVGNQLTEIVRTHHGTSKQEARERAAKLLEKVGISEPERRLEAYPHELSGGMRQRVAIARALAGDPDLLIADEPTTNLDVTIQAQVLNLLRDLQRDLNMSLIIITHDMGIIAEMAARVVVLYAGRVAESGRTNEIFRAPKHPYTSALLAAVPRVDVRRKLFSIPGTIPNLIDPPSGCRFHPRCPHMTQRCASEIPPLEEIPGGRKVACHYWRDLQLAGAN